MAGHRRDLGVRLAERGFTRVEPLGRGLEFSVFLAEPGNGGDPVAIRVAERRFDSTVNDPRVDTRALLRQEYRLARLLRDHGLPVAEPVTLILGETFDEPDILVSRYVEDDGSELDSFLLGGLLARLHALPLPELLPGLRLVAAGRSTAPRLLVGRILRRWNEIGRLTDDWPPAPSADRLLPIAAPLGHGCLLHLDVRRANVRCHKGEVRALLDWSNAVLAHPALEFGRLGEFARLPENQVDLVALRTGYELHAEPPPETGPLELLCRLDAAVMLALVFLAESPDPVRANAAVERVLELCEHLER
ncbi:phosphotransferase [Nonomuraea sp. B19D2]|uniref:phosphotransferase family protein n=1 Tax=Nonomuraea sp. B19D2 TaxID=3159561 RepID=UPI0032DB0F1C